MTKIRFERVTQLPASPVPNTQYFVKPASDGPVKLYVTGSNNIPELVTSQGEVIPAVNISYSDPVAPTYLKTISDIISGIPVSVMRFIPSEKIQGIINRTNSDDLAPYIMSALASGVRDLAFPPGLYNTDSSLVMSSAYQALRGAGRNATEIRIRGNSGSAIALTSGVPGYGLYDMSVTRVGTPSVGACGVECLGTTDDSTISGLLVSGHYDNIVLGTCDVGHIRNIRSRKALNHGIRQSNASSYGPSQWDADDILVDQNGGDGWRVAVTNGPAGLILGQIRNLKSFGNSGWGLQLVGTSTTGIYDLRLADAFMGSDGLGSVRLHTYGGKHRLSGFFERNGVDPTGPALGTAASGIGVGVGITASNSDVMMTGSLVDNNALDGIFHEGGILTVTGNHIYNNGQAKTSGRASGILSNGGSVVASGNTITNVGGNTTQQCGIAASHDRVVIGTSNLAGNTAAPTALGGLANAVVLGNAGTPQHSIPSNSGLSVGNPTGATGPGNINVASDVLKNGTTYNNP